MAAASLPDELLARVLSPVDLKSLVQARAVCKSWQTSVEGKQVSDLRATTVTAEPLIALIGGCESNGFNPSTKISFRIGLDGAWFDGPPMPEPRFRHGAAVVGRKIYVVGGRISVTDVAERTLVYDLWTATWSEAPGLQSGRYAAVVAALPDGRIVCAGGKGETGIGELRSCEIFDPKVGTWTAAAPMCQPRYWAAGALLDGGLVVVGGSGGSANHTMERYDAAADRWEFLPPISKPSFQGCAASIGGKNLFVFEGDACSYYRADREAPTVLRRVDKSEVTPITGNFQHWADSGEHRSGICRPVEARGVRGRIIGDYGAKQHRREGHTGPFDILVTDDAEPNSWDWLPRWWATISTESSTGGWTLVDLFDHSTCVAVGGEIMVFGGSNECHWEGDLDTNLALSSDDDIEYVQQRFEAETFNHAWRVALDADGYMHEITFDRAGARISEQSEGAVAVVVGL